MYVINNITGRHEATGHGHQEHHHQDKCLLHGRETEVMDFKLVPTKTVNGCPSGFKDAQEAFNALFDRSILPHRRSCKPWQPQRRKREHPWRMQCSPGLLLIDLFALPPLRRRHATAVDNDWKSIQTPSMSVGHGQSPTLDNGVDRFGHDGGLLVPAPVKPRSQRGL